MQTKKKKTGSSQLIFYVNLVSYNKSGNHYVKKKFQLSKYIKNTNAMNRVWYSKGVMEEKEEEEQKRVKSSYY